LFDLLAEGERHLLRRVGEERARVNLDHFLPGEQTLLSRRLDEGRLHSLLGGERLDLCAEVGVERHGGDGTGPVWGAGATLTNAFGAASPVRVSVRTETCADASCDRAGSRI